VTPYTYLFDVDVTVKNDGLTQDCTQKEITEILMAAIQLGLMQLSWVLTITIAADGR
jgi:hypothetical protein